MQAYTCPKYGPPEVLRLKEVEKPSPRSDEVRIKVHATGVTASDIFIRGSQIPIRYWVPMRLMVGLTGPRRSIIGLALAGDIEAVGADTKRFKVGDQVYGLTGFSLGAYAEYKCMRETDSKQGCLALKPANLTYEEATVAAYGGLLALQYMERGNVKPGEKVLVYGASSTSGTTAVQFAKHLGAQVTGVCSTANLELVSSLGADRVIDYTKVDSLSPGEQFDLVLDAVGRRKTSRLKAECMKALSPGGRYVSIDDGNLVLEAKRLDRMRDLVEAGHVRPVVDRCYPFEEMIEAHRYVGRGHKRGGVAVTVGHGDKT
jgi:NADPH:quinone reductase-like Zn-dependent oxidoreductase